MLVAEWTYPALAVAMQDHKPFSPLHAKIIMREAPHISQSESQSF